MDYLEHKHNSDVSIDFMFDRKMGLYIIELNEGGICEELTFTDQDEAYAAFDELCDEYELNEPYWRDYDGD